MYVCMYVCACIQISKRFSVVDSCDGGVDKEASAIKGALGTSTALEGADGEDDDEEGVEETAGITSLTGLGLSGDFSSIFSLSTACINISTYKKKRKKGRKMK